MKALITGVGFLFGLLAAGNSLVCEECTDYKSSNCHGEQKTCGPNALTCETTILEIIFANKPVNYMVFKGCSEQPCQDLFYSESTEGLNDRMKRVCCHGDGCNAKALEFAPRNHTLNGVKCPMCFREHALECESIGTVPCAGDETSCITFTGEVDLTGGNNPYAMVYHGCVNQENCDPFPRFPEGVIPAIHDAKCVKGDNS